MRVYTIFLGNIFENSRKYVHTRPVLAIYSSKQLKSRHMRYAAAHLSRLINFRLDETTPRAYIDTYIRIRVPAVYITGRNSVYRPQRSIHSGIAVYRYTMRVRVRDIVPVLFSSLFSRFFFYQPRCTVDRVRVSRGIVFATYFCFFFISDSQKNSIELCRALFFRGHMRR